MNLVTAGIRDASVRRAFDQMVRDDHARHLRGLYADRPETAPYGAEYQCDDAAGAEHAGEIYKYWGDAVGWLMMFGEKPTTGDPTVLHNKLTDLEGGGGGHWYHANQGINTSDSPSFAGLILNGPLLVHDEIDYGKGNVSHGHRLYATNLSVYWYAGDVIKLGTIVLPAASQQVIVQGKVSGQTGGSPPTTEFTMAIRTNALPSVSIGFTQRKLDVGGCHVSVSPYYLVDANSLTVVICAFVTSIVYTCQWSLDICERGDYGSYTHEWTYQIFDPTAYTLVPELDCQLLFDHHLWLPDNKHLYLGDDKDVSVYFDGTYGRLE